MIRRTSSVAGEFGERETDSFGLLSVACQFPTGSQGRFVDRLDDVELGVGPAPGVSDGLAS